MKSRKTALTLLVCTWVMFPSASWSQDAKPNRFPAQDRPVPSGRVEPIETVDRISVPRVDVPAAQFEDELRAGAGLPPRYAIPTLVNVTTDSHGTWEVLGRKRWVWRLRVAAPDAVSINLGFDRYTLPEGARLLIYDAHDPERAIRAFTAADNESHGELWTPPLPTDELVVELVVPRDSLGRFTLELGQIGYGYRGFGAPNQPAGSPESGACNVDVVCPEGDDWEAEIPSNGVISLGGGTFCSGSMLNNTAEDCTPYFLTAAHCGINSGNAASLVVFWNYENSTCRTPGGGASGGSGDGSLSQFNTGSFFRAAYSASDFTLVELDDDPDPGFGVTFSGWDRSGADATSAVAIHHPNTDEKRISFENQPTTVTTYLENGVPGNGTHVRVEDWDLGTTEPGSSGSPLYDQNHRVIGQLHGGFASCSSQTSDWYGRIFTSWTGGGTSSTRLSDWLDPGNTGAMFVDTKGLSGMRVTPGSGLTAAGPEGGPFTGSSIQYTVSNKNSTSIDYEVTVGGAWLSVSNGSGTIAGDGSTVVTVNVNGTANGFGTGLYVDTITFTNLTDGDGDTTRPANLEVGAFVFTANDVPQALPDGTGVPVNSTIFVNQRRIRAADVDVVLDISHTYVGDLCISLSHNGRTATLVQRPGTGGACHNGSPYGCSENGYSDAVIDDEGGGGALEAQCIAGLASPPNYTPTGPLSVFDGVSIHGAWTLSVSDNAGADTGSLLGWSLRILPVFDEPGGWPQKEKQ